MPKKAVQRARRFAHTPSPSSPVAVIEIEGVKARLGITTTVMIEYDGMPNAELEEKLENMLGPSVGHGTSVGSRKPTTDMSWEFDFVGKKHHALTLVAPSTRKRGGSK